MLLMEELTGKVIAAAIHVHKQLGPGFMEVIYEKALKIELEKRGIKFESQKQIQVNYEGQLVGTHVLDLMVEGQLIVELSRQRNQ